MGGERRHGGVLQRRRWILKKRSLRRRNLHLNALAHGEARGGGVGMGKGEGERAGALAAMAVCGWTMEWGEHERGGARC